MRALLTSSGLSNASIVDSLKGLCDKPLEQLNLAYIPTAANVESGDKGWVIDCLNRCEKLGFKSIDIVDISAIPIEMVIERLNDADILFFGGGNTHHLMHWVRQSGLSQYMPELLRSRVYVGESAGSMIACRNLVLADTPLLYNKEKIGAERMEGLGIVNFNIRPHFQSPDFPNMSVENISKVVVQINEPIYAIDDATAIEVIDGDMKIVSEGEWQKFE